MPPRTRLLAPLATALVSSVVLGLLSLAPAPADAATHDGPARTTAHTKAQATAGKHGGHGSRTVFPRSSYLCYGYADCKSKGMGNAGYAAANDRMYWRMYSGHNCTNYAAYRMVKSGLPNTRPWSGGGNATYWGTSVPGKTNGTPTVGAVAWWRANVGPAGSAGHVAYVEQVVSADEVIVSQDSWGGDFSWAVITRSSGNWPSGFIHFNDVPLLNKKAPVITGLPKVGETLTASGGTWRPGDATVHYQWYANGTALPRGVKKTYRLGPKRAGQTITVKATATKLGYPTASATSAATAVVAPGMLTNQIAPVVAGEPKVDHTLTVDPGEWDPAPSGYAIQWYADGRPVVGATATTLTLTPDLVGAAITVTVTASRDSYDPVTVTTAPTAPVAPGTFSVERGPSVAGAAKPGQTLRLDPGLYTPSIEEPGVDVDLQWLRDGEPILNATGDTYAVSALDLGAKISARVTVSRPGYETVERTSVETAVVRTTPRMTLTREKLNHRVKMLIEVTAPDVDEVTGTVLVKIQGGFRQEVTLVHGRAKLSVSDLRQGRRTVRLVYRGSDVVEGTLTTGAIWMPAPKGAGHPQP